MKDASGRAGQAQGNVLYSIQVLRGLGALLVVFYHAAMRVTGDSPTAFPHGQLGVDIFFVISGIVIYLSGRRLSAGGFLIRRLLRVVPLYWLLLLISLAGDAARGSYGPYQISNYLLSFVFIPSHDQPTTVFPPVIVGWTLNYEMFFYAICTAAILLFGGARLIKVATISILASVLLGLATADLIPWRRYPVAVLLLPITLEFVAGMWLGYFSEYRRIAPKWIAALLFVGAIAWIAVAPTAKAYTSWRLLAWGIPAIAIVWAAVSTEDLIPFRRMKPALLLGDASYALYLIHQVVMGILWAIFGKLHLQHLQALSFTALVIAAIIGGIVMHLIIERPLLRFLGRYVGIGRPARAAVASVDLAEETDRPGMVQKG